MMIAQNKDINAEYKPYDKYFNGICLSLQHYKSLRMFNPNGWNVRNLWIHLDSSRLRQVDSYECIGWRTVKLKECSGFDL